MPTTWDKKGKGNKYRSKVSNDWSMLFKTVVELKLWTESGGRE